MNVTAQTAASAPYKAMQRRIAAMPSVAGAWAKGYLYVSLAFFSGALDRPLSGGGGSFTEVVESPIIQILGVGIYAVALALVIRGRVRFRPSIVNLSFVLLALWAVASTGWSGEPDIAFRRSIGFAGTVLFGFAAVSIATPRDLIRIMVHVSIGLILVSGFVALLDPHFAFHQAGEEGVAEHAGRMRGTFAHKNEFARILAVAVILIGCFGRRVLREPMMLTGILLASMPMMVLAGSAKILAAVPLSVIAALMLRTPGKPIMRLLLITFFATAAGLLFVYGDLEGIMNGILGLLGRDAELSGRDVIWEAAVRSIKSHMIFGQGYFTGWRAQAMLEIESMKDIVIGHAHNGYLETILDLGLVGFAMAMYPVYYVGRKALLFPHYGPRRLHMFMSMWIVLFIFVNFSGSYLTNYNDLFTVFMIFISTWIQRIERGEIDYPSYEFLSR